MAASRLTLWHQGEAADHRGKMWKTQAVHCIPNHPDLCCIDQSTESSFSKVKDPQAHLERNHRLVGEIREEPEHSETINPSSIRGCSQGIFIKKRVTMTTTFNYLERYLLFGGTYQTTNLIQLNHVANILNKNSRLHIHQVRIFFATLLNRAHRQVIPAAPASTE